MTDQPARRYAHPIPRAALDDRLGFIGTSGSGKTYNAGTAVENLLASNARVVIVDPLGVWWGLRLLADSKTASPFDVAIFGGAHGDLPLTEHAGSLIGETSATMAESCIIDLSELKSRASERRFMVAFLETLYRKASGEPFHLIVDESDLFAPQKPQAGDEVLLGHMENIVRRGRIKGFIPWLITQRPAVVNKNVLSQVDGLIAFKLTSTQDRDALDAWIEGQADKAEGKRIKDSLPTLQIGRGVVWIPGRSVLDASASFPIKTTFDSSRTPKRGQKLQHRKLKALDIGALKERLAIVEAETKASDPKALRAEVIRLKSEIQKLSVAKTDAIPHDPKAIETAEERGFERAKKQLTAAAERQVREAHLNILEVLRERLSPLDALIDEEIKRAKGMKAELAKAVQYAPVAPPAPRPQAIVTRPARAATTASGDGNIPAGERAILTAVAQYPAGAERDQLTVLTGYKRSTRDAYLQRLLTRGFVAVTGSRIDATEEGVAALGSDFKPLPTGAALQAYWMSRLPEGERKILGVLIEAYPNHIDRDALDEATGYKRSTRDAYLQRLDSRRLVTADRSIVRASEILFQNAA